MEKKNETKTKSFDEIGEQKEKEDDTRDTRENIDDEKNDELQVNEKTKKDRWRGRGRNQNMRENIDEEKEREQKDNEEKKINTQEGGR